MHIQGYKPSRVKTSSPKPRAAHVLKQVFHMVAPPSCFICGGPLPNGAERLCHYCLLRHLPRIYPESGVAMLPEHVHWSVSHWHFREGQWLQKLIHQLKYRSDYPLGMDLGRMAALLFVHHYPHLCPSCSPQDCLLVPVPIHPKRRLKRGYNQSYAIAEGWVRILPSMILDEGILSRTESRPSQVGLNKFERRENMRSIYTVEDPGIYAHRSKHAVVIDDVMTTGATCFELCRLLVHLGFKQLSIMTLGQA